MPTSSATTTWTLRRFERRHGPERRNVHVVVAEDVGIRIPEVLEAAHDGVVGGSVPLACDDPAKVRNSCLVYDPDGRRVARYDKIHLFGLDLGAERFDEARTIEAGTQPCAIESPFGRIALSVCYDVRFPELYRALAPMDIILVPSAFTATTGGAHWETLLRARAIENLAWVLAPAQGGKHPNGRRTHGHSMVVDPWGKVIAERAAGPGVVVAGIDPAFQAKMRRSLPALSHRVLQRVQS